MIETAFKYERNGEVVKIEGDLDDFVDYLAGVVRSSLDSEEFYNEIQDKDTLIKTKVSLAILKKSGDPLLVEIYKSAMVVLRLVITELEMLEGFDLGDVRRKLLGPDQHFTVNLN